MNPATRHYSSMSLQGRPSFLFLVLILTGGAWANADRPIVAVLGFEGATRHQALVASASTSIITNALVNSDKFELIKAEAAVSALDAGGGVKVLANEAAVNRLGNELGCQYVIFGEVSNAEVNSQQFSGYGVTSYKTSYHLSVCIKVMDIYHKRIVFTRILENSSTPGVSLDSSPGFVTSAFTALAKKPVEKIILPLEAALLKDIKADANENLSQFSDDTQNATNAPAQAGYSLRFTSNVPAAMVEIDGVVEGTCADKISVAEGVHEVSITSGGYAPVKLKIRISKDLSLPVELVSSKNRK